MQKKALALGIALAAASSIALAQPQGGGNTGGPRGPGGQGMLQHMDTDRDGRVSQAEHQAATANRFQKQDANSDGYITQEEMQASRAKNEEFRQKMQELRQQYRR